MPLSVAGCSTPSSPHAKQGSDARRACCYLPVQERFDGGAAWEGRFVVHGELLRLPIEVLGRRQWGLNLAPSGSDRNGRSDEPLICVECGRKPRLTRAPTAAPDPSGLHAAADAEPPVYGKSATSERRLATPRTLNKSDSTTNTAARQNSHRGTRYLARRLLLSRTK